VPLKVISTRSQSAGFRFARPAGKDCCFTR
jgi:hypothetical protein